MNNLSNPFDCIVVAAALIVGWICVIFCLLVVFNIDVLGRIFG